MAGNIQQGLIILLHDQRNRVQYGLDVTGHTDSTGSDDYNLDLSNRRALSVANYLSQLGQIDGRRFAVAGLGETRPIASNASTQGRSANRRVEIQISPLQ